jgi:hypothetical protein
MPGKTIICRLLNTFLEWEIKKSHEVFTVFDILFKRATSDKELSIPEQLHHIFLEFTEFLKSYLNAVSINFVSILTIYYMRLKSKEV